MVKGAGKRRKIGNCADCGTPKYTEALYIYPSALKQYLERPCLSCSVSGKRNHQWGKVPTKQHRKKASDSIKKRFEEGYNVWNAGKKFGKSYGEKISKGMSESETYIKSRIGIGYKISLGKLGLAQNLPKREYEKLKTKKIKYYQAVWRITNKQPIEKLKNYHKRGKAKKGKDHYQVDHIISIIEGYDKGISPKKIGDIKNLRMLPWKKNIMRQYENKQKKNGK
jgi:hypothetical protein